MKLVHATFFCWVVSLHALADMKYHPIRFVLSTSGESYYEGGKITFNITITNTDKTHSYPVLLPHTQNTGSKTVQS
jgi:hypothetical protein